MVEWWACLGSSDNALVVSASGIVLAAATFIWNQCHQVSNAVERGWCECSCQ